MPGILTTEAFNRWLKRLNDQRGRAKILVRLDRLLEGNPGDARSVGARVTEMRIDFGPGYRVYFTRRGDSYVMLVAGDKSSQRGDIATAQQLAKELHEQDEDD
jgi:putative addiction module killer protein